MITNQDKKYLTEAGKILLFEITSKSKKIKKRLPIAEYINLHNEIKNLTYEEVIELVVSESLRDFEGKFSKFIKYGFAALAGTVLGGPTTAMLALYLYRKFTDPCQLACVKNVPLSNKKKVCKYKCQIDAIRKIQNDLRTEMGKCNGVKNPNKCKEKLQGEYLKWTERMKTQVVKYHQANAGAVAKSKQQSQEQ